MYKYRRQPKKLRFRPSALIAPLVVMGLTGSSYAFLPFATQTQAPGSRVFSEGLNIELDRTSPAFAALEDSWLSDHDENPSVNAEEKLAQGSRAEALLAGTVSGQPLAERILRENRREQALYAQERAARDAATRAFAQAAATALKDWAQKIATPAAPRELVQEKDFAASPNSNSNHQAASASRLPAIEHPTRTISLTDLRMSREELLGSIFLPIARSDQSDDPGPGTIIAGGRVISHAVAKNDVAQWRPKESLAAATAPIDPGVASQGDSFGVASQESTHEAVRQIIVAGPIEFDGGLALSNTMDRVVIYREIDGETAEAGAVWLREGRYEIFVEQAVGFLVGELRTPYGDILGRGTFDLSRIRSVQDGQRKVDPVPLKIHPVTQGVTGIVVARGKGDTVKPVKDAQVAFRHLPIETNSRQDGKFEEANFLEGSSVVIRASRPGYWGTLAFARAGTDAQVEILPDQPGQTIQKLLSTVQSRSAVSGAAAIVYGRVARNGKPVAGAKVELMTTSENLRPIYFNNAMVPDVSLNATSANGLYAFFPVPAGAHAVQVTMEDRVTQPVIFPADERTVSRVDIETSTEKKARVKVFDAFRTDWPLAARLTHPGASQGLIVERTGEAVVKYADGAGLLVLDADSGQGYERVRLSLDRDRRVIYFPMIQSQWLENTRAAMRLNKEAQSGVVVGFVQGSSPYKVAIEEMGAAKNASLHYFNNRGEMTGLDYGEPGGGFVIYNMPQGFRSVTVQPSGTPKVYAALILVEPGVTNVINHWIR